MKSPNTRERNDGRDFERRVHDLLALRGVQNLTREKQFASKKADLFFEFASFGTRRRFAVECKDYGAVLTHSELSLIFASYSGLFRTGEITDLLIVSNSRLGPSAQSYVDSLPELSHVSFADMQASLIQFGGYLAGLRSRFLTDSAFNYYVDSHGSILDRPSGSRLQTPTDAYPNLLSLLLHELGVTDLPLVVVGTYGIGKTTLAKRLFLTLLDQLDADPSAPIPIYISLDRMTHEQSLEGLLGSLFTSVAPCEGYNFNLFCSLNAMGLFVLIFDGLDEMRHKLSWEEFLYNLDQLAILTAENPRSILLGRPTAFMDKIEYDTIIHGYSQDRTALRISSRISYREVNIDLFTDGQIQYLVEQFCYWKHKTDRTIKHRMLGLLGNSAHKNIHDIAERPVQLVMLLEVFPQLPDQLDKITETLVYSLFIDELIAREKAKKVARAFSPAEHRLFSQRVAAWLWMRGGTQLVEAKHIPRELMNELIGPNDDPDVIRRSLVMSSFLGTQGGTFLHFPHRSIQEFLISEHCAQLLLIREALLNEFRARRFSLDMFTIEICAFLSAQLSMPQIEELMTFFDVVQEIPRSALALGVSELKVRRYIFEYLRRTGKVTALWFCVYDAIRSKKMSSEDKEFKNEFSELIYKLVVERKNRYVREDDLSARQLVVSELLCYLLAMLIISTNAEYHRYGYDFLAALEILKEFGRFDVSSTGLGGKKLAKNEKEFIEDPIIHELRQKLAVNIFGKRLNVDWIYKYVRSKTKNIAFVPEWVVGDTIQIPDITLPLQFSVNESLMVELEELKSVGAHSLSLKLERRLQRSTRRQRSKGSTI